MGRVAHSALHPKRNSFRLILTAVALSVCLMSALAAFAQSGRRKNGAPKQPPGPIADPDRRGSPVSPTAPSKSVSDELDNNDVVRITSNLVPIPVSVLDKRGNAVVNLKLEDFELLVDGQPRPLTELSRSETSVRLAMLFDNSGSLDAAREFEKHAAIRFFRKVMRAKDEAAIYSIETDSRLVQPLTSDVQRLEQ